MFYRNKHYMSISHIALIVNMVHGKNGILLKYKAEKPVFALGCSY